MQESIRKMPKIVLHLHLDGSLRPETVQQWLQEKGDTCDLEEVKRNLMVEKDCRSLNEYLQKFDLPAQVLQNKEHIKTATYELFEDLKKQGVIYAEVRFAPMKHTQEGLTCDEVVASAIEGMNMAKEKCKIDGSLILCCMRGDRVLDNKQVVDSAKKFLGRGVSSIDLAGAEALFPTKDYEEIFNEANIKGIPFTIHAGEADGPESIKDALRFGAKRIGHGVRCIEDEELIKTLVTTEIPLEICPISNLQTLAIQGKHPIEELYKEGILVTISPDNDTVSNTNIIEEYEWILQNTELTEKDLIQMNINAARFAFTTPVKKAELIAKIQEYQNKENKEFIK